MMIRRLAFALILFAAVSLPVLSKDWVRVQSKNFTAFGNAGSKDMQKALIRLEQFRYILSVMFGERSLRTSVPTYIYLFNDDYSFRPFKPLSNGKIKENVGGYFLSRPDGNYIALNAEARGQQLEDTYAVIFHEYQHFVLRQKMRNAPLWLNEGLAEYYSTFKPDDDFKTFMMGGPIAWHVYLLRDKPLLPLRTLFAVDSKSPHYNESSKQGVFYAESWVLIHYLMMRDQGTKRAQLAQFIGGLNSDMTIEENFKKSFGMEFKDIEEQLRQYVQKFSFLMEKRTLTREYALDRDVRVDKMTDGESQTVLADLLINLGRFEDAEKRLQKAAAGQEIPASAKAALGWVSFLNKRPDMAETRLQEATRVDPGNYRGNLYLARALASKGRQEDALAAYKKAAESGEATAQLYAEIADLYVDMQRDGEAIEAFKKALNLEADNARYFRSVTYAYLRRGEWKFASMSAMTYLRDEGWRDDSSPYMVLAGLFGYLHTNSEPDVKRVLTQALERLDKANWPYPVFEYLNGARDSASLIEAAGTDNDKLTEAHAYVGINLAIQDKKDEAATHLSWVVENGNKRFVEYPWAASELKRIVEPEGPPVAK